jgi:hypothetical protein
MKGDTLHMLEWFGDLGKVSNEMKLDVEGPFRVPGDKEGTIKLLCFCVNMFYLTYAAYITYPCLYPVVL